MKVDNHEPVTVDMVRQLLMDGMEDTDTPAKMLEVLGDFAGKPWSKRILRKLEEHIDRPRFGVLSSSHVNLEWGGYGYAQDGDKGGSLVIYYCSEGNRAVCPDWIRQKNPAYFEAAVNRNQQRAELLRDLDTLRTLCRCINQVRQHWNLLQDLTDYGRPASAISTALDRLTGLEKRRH